MKSFVVKVNRFVMAKREEGNEKANLNAEGLQRHGSCKEVRWSQSIWFVKAAAINLIWQRSGHSKRGGKEAANPESERGCWFWILAGSARMIPTAPATAKTTNFETS